LENRLTILITSCDKFSDTWEPLADSFNEFWSDCSFPTRLLTNHKNFERFEIKAIKVGEDLDWSSNLKKALQSITTEYVLLWLDDVFISEKVDNTMIQEILNFIKKNDSNFLRLRPFPMPDFWVENNFGIILPKSFYYRVSIFSTIWKKSILESLLFEGESAWKFELNGSKRSVSIEKFYCTRNPIFQYIHGIEKGLWKKDAVEWLQKRDQKPDFEYRRMMNESEVFKYKIGQLKLKFINLIPGKFRHTLVRFVQRIYVLIGIRKETTF
jgi:hypothetical protein